MNCVWYSWVVNFDVSGVHFKKALFVPNISVYNKVWSSALPPIDSQVDLSWQLTLQKLWENLNSSEKGITLLIIHLLLVGVRIVHYQYDSHNYQQNSVCDKFQ